MEAYSDTTKFYISDMTPSPSVETRSLSEDSMSSGHLSSIDVERPSPKADTARLKGTKRAGKS